MIISLERSALLEAVTRLQRAVGSKTSMPVLEGILLSAEQGKVTLISYNLEMGMKKEIYAKCDEEGDIVINARLLCDKIIRIDGGLLSEMVKGTFFAAAQSEGAKPILTGINVTVENGIIQFVAIDGYRLAIRKEKVDISDDFSFIVSGRAIGEAVKLIDESTEEVEMKVGNNLISFNINGYEFISRLLEGEFVNYKKTIPAEHKQRVVVNTMELIDTVERVSLLISEAFSTPVRCYFNELNVVFTCATSMGRATETFNTELEGEGFEIGLNSRYLLDALKAIEDEKIQILFNGANAGVLIKPLEGDDYTYMIMPMRLR